MTTQAEEISELRNENFLPEDTPDAAISDDLHLHKCWADSFWRRRSSLQNRPDPEVIWLTNNSTPSFQQTLEIGAAYGRVTSKLVQLQQVNNITAIDINPHFEAMFRQYSDMVEPVTFITGDFLNPNSLEPNRFDLVVLPMNTVPSFPSDYLERLFDRVQKVLKPGGWFVFSTYPERAKIRNDRHLKVVLEEPGEVPLTVEYFNLKEQEVPPGPVVVSYHKYYYQTGRDHDEKFYFRTVRNIYQHDYLEKLLQQNSMVVTTREKVEHSTVFVCEKNSDNNGKS